jgi:hypothetical protein
MMNCAIARITKLKSKTLVIASFTCHLRPATLGARFHQKTPLTREATIIKMSTLISQTARPAGIGAFLVVAEALQDRFLCLSG